MGTEPAPRSTPSISSLPRSTLISAIAAIVLLVSVFFNWYTATVSVSGGSALPNIGNISRSQSASGWDSTDVAKLVALLALVAIAAWVIEVYATNVNLPWPAWMIAAGAGALAALLVLFRIVSKPGGNIDSSFSFGSTSLHVDVGTALGIWLSLIAAVVVCVGAYMAMREAA